MSSEHEEPKLAQRQRVRTFLRSHKEPIKLAARGLRATGHAVVVLWAIVFLLGSSTRVIAPEQADLLALGVPVLLLWLVGYSAPRFAEWLTKD